MIFLFGILVGLFINDAQIAQIWNDVVIAQRYDIVMLLNTLYLVIIIDLALSLPEDTS